MSLRRKPTATAWALLRAWHMADVRLNGLLGEEEPLVDLAVDETVGHELQDLDLAGGRLLQ